jgi:tetrathionate reductase subunit B
MDRRSLLKKLFLLIPATAAGRLFSSSEDAKSEGVKKKSRYGMGIQVNRCIGCLRCVEACKIENNVPQGNHFFRTWIERYIIKRENKVSVQMVERGEKEYTALTPEKDILRSFFVPKLCNHCTHPPCAQVCPVGATFLTEEGVVLVSADRCIGCGYCVQACPYGARYLHPQKRVADKCTFCYHRVKKGKVPVCVMVCPNQARVFGDLNSLASPLVRIKRMKNIHVLKPYLNTEPKVFYTDLDGEVK